MGQPRSAAANPDFPYTMPTICYIEVRADGTVTFGGGQGAYERTRSGESRLYAVWPGQYRSDLFVIDDLDEYAEAMGIVHSERRTGLADHEHDVRWIVNHGESNPSGSYATIDVNLDCGCTIKNLATFAAQMRQQKGWDIAKTGGFSSGTPAGGSTTYTLRVRRKSLH